MQYEEKSKNVRTQNLCKTAMAMLSLLVVHFAVQVVQPSPASCEVLPFQDNFA